MKSLWIDKKVDYDGGQLQRMFAYENFGLIGNSILSFRGACDISNENMKDGEDLFSNEKIYSEDMLHFLIECHDTPLETMIGYQRLFTCLLKEALEPSSEAHKLIRDGDDIFYEEKKINISIATGNALSSMVHCGINVSSKNTPVPTIGLQEFGLEPKGFALGLMEKWLEEYCGIQEAKAKVFIL